MDATPTPAPFRIATPTPSAPPATSASQPIEAKPTVSPAEAPSASDSIAPGLTIYAEVTGYPYTAEFFEAKSFIDGEDINGIKQDIYGVDQYILEHIAERGLKNTPDAYKEVIDAIDQQIGKYENEKPLEHFKRVSSAIKAMQRMKSARVKPVFDMSKLTPLEYSEIFGGHSVY